MITASEVLETNRMVEEENLDVRTITMGISLLDCADSSLDATCDKIYTKITTLAKDLVKTGESISREIGIPIVHKRVSVTPVSLVGSACCHTIGDYVRIAQTLDKAAKEIGVNFLGGFSAIVSKGMTHSDELLIRSIPTALATTDVLCSSVNVGSTKTGINMDAVRLMGDIVKDAAEATKDKWCIGPAKLVVFCNAPDDNPFMAGAFHGVSEADAIINVGVSGPGVVKYALEQMDRQVKIDQNDENATANFEKPLRDHQADGLQDYPRGTVRGTGSQPTSQCPLWHHRPFTGSHTCHRRLSGRHSQMHRCGTAWCPRHYRSLGLTQ